MFKKKSKVLSLLASISITSIMLSCGSVNPETSIQRGDYVTAIETLSSKLSKRPNDEKNADLFVSIYPMVLEQKIPDQTVAQIIEESLPGYKSNAIATLKKQAGKSSGPLSNQTEITQTIRKSELIISNLKDCIRIQNAVITVPSQIGNSKKGQIYFVKKYDNNFNSMHKDAVSTLGMFYYNMAEALYPGDGIDQKKEILGYYSSAKNYSVDIQNLNTRSAEICYQIASEYENSSDSIANKNEAINWYKKALSWSSGYKDSQTKIYKMNYEIALIYERSAKTISDYETVLNYLGNAGTYKDSVTRKQDITYMLALEYKNTLNASSYEKAGTYFKSLGNYQNAQREAYLYDFYKKLITLEKTNRYNSVSLTNGKANNNFIRKIDSATTRYTNINVSGKTFYIPVYTIIKDGTISPGAMFEGNSIANEKYTSFVSGDRKPLDYVIYGGNGWKEINEGTITYPGTRSANSEITAKALKSYRYLQPEYQIEYYQVYSDEDLAMTLGTGFERNSFVIGRNADWNSNVLLVKITQKYYTAAIEAPKMPYEFFTTNTSNTVKDSSLSSVSPYYVDSVDYGRAAYLVFSTELPLNQFKYQLQLILENEAYSSSIIRNNTSRWDSYNTTVSGIAIGDRSTSLSSYDRVFEWIREGSNMVSYVDQLPPISFTIRCLSNNANGLLTQSGTFRILNPDYDPTATDDSTTTKPALQPEETKPENPYNPGPTIREPLKPINKN